MQCEVVGSHLAVITAYGELGRHDALIAALFLGLSPDQALLGQAINQHACSDRLVLCKERVSIAHHEQADRESNSQQEEPIKDRWYPKLA